MSTVQGPPPGTSHGHGASGTSASHAAGGKDFHELVSECEDVIRSFDPLKTTVDSHAEDKLGKITDDTDADTIFVQQVFYGCIRYQRALKVFLSSFYFKNSGTTLRTDYTLYMIFTYLALFRLKEMGWSNFRHLILGDDPAKMDVFLSFLFSKENLDKWMRDEWCAIFDYDYVDKELIGGVLHFERRANDLCGELKDKAYGLAAEEAKKKEGMKVKSSGKTLTRPKSPNISAPKPRTVPKPMKIPQGYKAKPVPHKMLARTSLSKIEAEAKARREKLHHETHEKYAREQKEFNLHETKSSLARLREEREAELMAENKVRFKAKPAPDMSRAPPARVKYNAGAILREDALYKKKQSKEASLLRAYESELRDSTEFYRWQKEMREVDEKAKFDAVEARRLAMIEGHIRTVEAVEKNLQERKKAAKEMRERGVREAKELEEEHAEEIRQNRKKVEAVHEVAHKPAEAMAKVKVENRKAAKELRRIGKELEKERARKAKIEQERKADIIRQIQALERAPRKRVVHFDPTESSGMGLLEEMSLVELRERLTMNKAEKEQELIEKKQNIVELHRKREVKMHARIKNITRVRKAAAEANRSARKHEKEEAARKVFVKSELLKQKKLELAKKLEKKRAEILSERKELREEEERVAKQRMFLGAAAKMVEEKAFKSLRSGAQREAKAKQDEVQREAKIAEETQAKVKKIRASNVRKARAAEARKDEIAKRKLKEQRKKALVRAKKLTATKKEIVRKERERAAEVEAEQKLNPLTRKESYTHTITERTRHLFEGKTADLDEGKMTDALAD